MNNYPANDNKFEDLTITKVGDSYSGWEIERNDGFSFYVPNTSPIVPKPGMIARFYGNGIGYSTRGLFIDGHKVFYFTADEYEIKSQNELYGESATEWLRRWDAGDSVWSISMGGMGPGYEQAIQISVAEMLRVMIDKQFDSSTWASGTWAADRDILTAITNQVLDPIGLSGAQHGAAVHLARKLYMLGPVAIMTTSELKDRHIQVSKQFPTL